MLFVSFPPFLLRKKLLARSVMLFVVKLLILGSFVDLRRTMGLLSYAGCMLLNFLADMSLHLLSQKKVQGSFLTGNQGTQEFLRGFLCFWRREALCGWCRTQSENCTRAGCQTRTLLCLTRCPWDRKPWVVMLDRQTDSIKMLHLFNFNYGVCLIVALVKRSHRTRTAPVRLCEDTWWKWKEHS